MTKPERSQSAEHGSERLGGAKNTWVEDSNPTVKTDSDGWWVDPQSAHEQGDARSSDGARNVDSASGASAEPDTSEESAGGAKLRSLSSAQSLAHRNDEGAARHRHPSTSPRLIRASDLNKPVEQRTAPDIELPAAAPLRMTSADVRGDGNVTRGAKPAPKLRIVEQQEEAEPAEASDAELREQAELALVKKLRGKGLSLSEARSYLRGLGYENDVQFDVVETCVARGYLDDAVLAEQIVYAGSIRKGQGRRAISLALSARGIDRDVIEAALSELPDDDAERALDFARTRASSLSRLEPAVALRRLMGQLSRRGFGGSVARDAATEALREVSSGPRFR